MARSATQTTNDETNENMENGETSANDEAANNTPAAQAYVQPDILWRVDGAETIQDMFPVAASHFGKIANSRTIPVVQAYKEGHVLTAVEARALSVAAVGAASQTAVSYVTKGRGKGMSDAEKIAHVTKICNTYSFDDSYGLDTFGWSLLQDAAWRIVMEKFGDKLGIAQMPIGVAKETFGPRVVELLTMPKRVSFADDIARHLSDILSEKQATKAATSEADKEKLLAQASFDE